MPKSRKAITTYCDSYTNNGKKIKYLFFYVAKFTTNNINLLMLPYMFGPSRPLNTLQHLVQAERRQTDLMLIIPISIYNH